MAAGFAASNDEDIDPRVNLRDRMLLGADKSGDRHAVALAHFQHDRWRHAERVGDQAYRKLKRNLECARSAFGPHVAGKADAALAVFVQVARLDTVGLENSGGKILVRLGHGSQQRGATECLGLSLHRIGNDEVDAIRLAAAMRIDPCEFFAQTSWRQVDRAEHAHAAGARDGCDHIAAVAEGEQGKVYTEHLADGRFHGAASRD
jgi:hypothetical protein